MHMIYWDEEYGLRKLENRLVIPVCKPATRHISDTFSSTI